MSKISREFFNRQTLEVAQDLIGTQITTRINGVVRKARIVETEAYMHGDPASHCRDQVTERNKAMFGPVGHLYTYISYGIHTCLNIVSRAADQKAGGVLIRAVEPLEGIDLPTNGPGKLTKALGITMQHYGYDLIQEQALVELHHDYEYRPARVACKRIGISQAQEKLYRFYDAKSSSVSKRFE